MVELSFLPETSTPALPAGAGHGDGCAASNRHAGGDGLRPAGADTPGSGGTAALCHRITTSVPPFKSACYIQGHGSMTHLAVFLFCRLPTTPPACTVAALLGLHVVDLVQHVTRDV